MFDANLPENWPSVVRLFGPPAVALRETWPTTGATFDHGALDRLLRRHVTERGLVDYVGLRGERRALADYLGSLDAVDLEQLARDEALALLLNAHHAIVLRLVVTHPEVPRTIREIPVRVRRAAGGRIGGRAMDLDSLRDDWLRARFREPRVHLAMSMATMGGAALRAEAWCGARLEAQLDDQARRFYASDKHVRLSSDRRGRRLLELDAVHLWYRGDFEQTAGSVLNHVAVWHAPLAEHLAACDRLPRVRWMPFDWRLDRAPRAAFAAARHAPM